ncbi:Rho family guanine nucleotide exchange factor TUS1 Ecym_7024 [Eremothecium cymbalariae DBVPG|uniref:Rho1 guanine nucleotide exchange factor TUS1 n=1 Tax=Eremothecium cymbalariae (strain CBS 270.75 / DBVPG 7215 / KCTC 17166 / NRRL Y-17582) TaxID=931890 RepID=G8JVL6_ERECY|nr:hypothetical protein Ecym_7024 [Eremothecium cymbalariae DBVPG\
MYNAKKNLDDDVAETKPKLPQLPPLMTKDASAGDHRTRIAWTPIDEHQIISPMASYTPSNSSNKSRRRPQPPVFNELQINSGEGSSAQPAIEAGTIYSLHNNVSTPTKPVRDEGRSSSDIRNRVYCSPLVGESKLQGTPDSFASNCSSNTGTSGSLVYLSPFIGDTTSAFVKQVPTKNSEISIMSDYAELPDITFADDESSGTPLRPLPALPTMAKLSVSDDPPLDHMVDKEEEEEEEEEQEHVYFPVPPANNFGTTREVESFLHPPTQLPLNANRRRLLSDRTFSESISSYYSSNSYAFNEYVKHGSLASVIGGKPLEQVPTVNVPTQPLNIDLLDESKLYQCYSVYQLSDIYEWLLRIYFEWFNEYIFGKIEFVQLVQLLLEFQLPNTYEQEIIDKNVDRIIESLVLQGAVRFEPNFQSPEEDVTIIVAGLDIQGVFTDLLPCYSFDHKRGISIDGRFNCYSRRCISQLFHESRPVIKISEVINKSVGLWTDYWNLTEEEISEINPKEVQRQSYMFDLIVLEEKSLNLAHAAIELYGSRFSPSLLPNDRNFSSLAFDIFHPLIELHKEFLLIPIFGKLQTLGKFIDGIGKIYLKWCNAAQSIYLQYAESMAVAHEIISWEKSHNTMFATWLKEIDKSPEITRSKLYHDVIFFGGFFKSLQNMPLTLRSILRCTDPSSDDYEFLHMATCEIEKLSAQVDKVHGAAIDQRKIIRFSRQLFIGSNSTTVSYVNIIDSGTELSNEEKLNLKLTEKTRKLFKEGIVYKKRDLWLEPSATYVVLLDNYFLVTEVVQKKNEKKYKLSERPIPIDYLSLEAKEDLKLLRKGIADKEVVLLNTSSSEPSVSSPGKTSSNKELSQNTIISKSVYKNSAINSSPEDIDNLRFSFKVRNTATNESFTFLTTTREERDSWVASIVESFQANNDDNDQQIFHLRLLSEQFGYDERQAPTNLLVAPEGSIIDLALQKHYSMDHPSSDPISADLKCFTKFVYESQTFVLCGSNNGVYMTTTEMPSSWKLVVNVSRVSHLEINCNFNLLFILTDKMLCYFNIPSLMCSYYDPEQYLPNNQMIGVMIRDKVSFFKMAEDFGNSRQLFYERKGKIIVLTPEIDIITGNFKFFKVYKEYKLTFNNSSLISYEIEDIVIFKTSFIVCSSRGALLFNESFNDEGIPLPSTLNDPDLSNRPNLLYLSANPFKTNVESSSKRDSSKLKMADYVRRDIAANKTKPITCFQLSNNDFVMIYDEAVIKMNKYGEIVKWKEDIFVLDFYCIDACMNNEYLILIGENLVQIYDFNYTGNIMNNALSKLTPVQIVKGKKIRLLNSQKLAEAVIVLSHPAIPGRQLLLEFYNTE